MSRRGEFSLDGLVMCLCWFWFCEHGVGGFLGGRDTLSLCQLGQTDMSFESS